MLRLTAVLAVASVAIALPAGADACGCGEVNGPVVARGVSPHGVPWHVRAQRDGSRQLIVDFSFDPPGYSDAGYGVGLPFPVPAAFVFSALPGSDLDPFGEQDVSGVTARRVVTVLVTMSDGSSLRIRPRLATRAAYVRHPWLRRLRFFDFFLPSMSEPRRATALDASGRVLARLTLE